MRTVENPRHRFERHYAEWLEEPPPARLEVYEETETRSVLSSNDSPDVPFRWSVNPYRGCAHACAYCYARPTHEYLGFGAGTDFETRIVAKLRAPDILQGELARRSWRGELIAFSGDTDCYQPVEAHYELTRRCLEACRDAANPVGIVTKSWLVTRDLGLVVDLSRRADVTVTFSVAFADDRTARLVEPGAPRPSRRLEALRAFAEAGVRTGVLLAPIIPGLNDADIPEILQRARQAGARHAGWQLLRLPHSVKEVFLGRVREVLPDRAARIEHHVREVRGGALSESGFGERHRGRGPLADVIRRLFDLHHARLGFAALEAEDAGRARPERPGEQLRLF